MTTATTAAAAATKALGASQGLSALEQKSLSGLTGPDRDRAEAQLMLQKQQEATAFVANLMKKLNEIAMSVIGKI
ncbi:MULTISPECIES: hypothetical protein [Myxococcaceae]|uniref:Uncharacterized protein n=2 Tax=Myxococcaceae TaxID=31 RepID=A0A250JUL7_9BACT|nr:MULTISPECIES: hypothetical protein [Myxococcaceae]AEI65896.1 hypothetical protein LILAB_19970 [Corallococcus macrosporus]AEI65899.1 hypothetical protein LILAB_19985 [Corallococcus macrosporus]ATB46813.1 hypothetical protein MYMAC_002418 [Corallococcus macrosporus DSM 14697]ATB46816.1 hypothetical protein MYMAC_002421 [Corallococcus macrosporus DSM 14697]WIG96147.1 hypothetical protein KGD87_01405 [Myxococcus sp. SDU36]